MIENFVSYGADELVKLAIIGKANPYDVIDELARRIVNRRERGNSDNPEAVNAYLWLSFKCDYKPLRPDKYELHHTPI